MKKDKTLNDEQNLAVYTRNSSILVSAPAGSGKTKILVNRIMSLIEDDHINVNQLLVLTFTKAAALEMKQRLVEQLNKKLHACDKDLKEHLEKQKQLLNDAYITNFHSFCSDLLSQYGYIINIDAKFEIIENPDLIKQNILEQCLDKWVKNQNFINFYKTHYTDYQFNKFKDIILQLDYLSHTVYQFDDYLKSIKTNLYDIVIQKKTYHQTPFESYLKRTLTEAYQEGYDAFLKLTDLCQNHGLYFYFEATAKLPSPYDVLQNYYQSLKTMIDQDQLLIHDKVELEKHRSAKYKDVDDEIKETYKTL